MDKLRELFIINIKSEAERRGLSYAAIAFFVPLFVFLFFGIKLGLDFDDDRWFIKAGACLWFVVSLAVGGACARTLDESLGKPSK